MHALTQYLRLPNTIVLLSNMLYILHTYIKFHQNLSTKTKILAIIIKYDQPREMIFRLQKSNTFSKMIHYKIIIH